MVHTSPEVKWYLHNPKRNPLYKPAHSVVIQICREIIGELSHDHPIPTRCFTDTSAQRHITYNLAVHEKEATSNTKGDSGLNQQAPQILLS
jgi:hypothetical protein